jgi:hypothetical protein
MGRGQAVSQKTLTFDEARRVAAANIAKLPGLLKETKGEPK